MCCARCGTPAPVLRCSAPAACLPAGTWLGTKHICSLRLARPPRPAAQVDNVCGSPIVQQAWDAGQPLAVHGLVYSLEDGLLKPLLCECGEAAAARCMRTAAACVPGAACTVASNPCSVAPPLCLLAATTGGSQEAKGCCPAK